MKKKKLGYKKSKSDQAIQEKHLGPNEFCLLSEGRMPEKQKQRWLNHLAECPDCRQLSTEINILIATNEIDDYKLHSRMKTAVITKSAVVIMD